MWEIVGVILFLTFVACSLVLSSAESLAWLLYLTHKYLGFPKNVKTGREGLIGRTGQVLSDFKEINSRMEGRIELNGEYWKAISDPNTTLRSGDAVKVVKIEGLTVYVLPLENT